MELDTTLTQEGKAADAKAVGDAISKLSGGNPDWNAEEGEPGHILNRTHWTESVVVEVLPETVLLGTTDELMEITVPFALTVGETYAVEWNGAAYECVAQEFDTGDGVFISLGDIGAMEGNPTTGEPFIVAALPEELAALGLYGLIIPLDGSSEATVAIYSDGEGVHKLDNKYLNLDWLPVLRYKKGEEVVSEQSGNIRDLGFTWFGQKVPYDLTPGNHYYVVWNGDAYHVRLVPGDGEFIFGRFTTKAFTISYMYDESEVESLRYGFRCKPLDGSTKVTFSIYESVVIPNTIPEEFLPDNIGGINITGASIGQIARISAVDAEGKPTEWEPIDLPDSGGNVDLTTVANTMPSSVPAKGDNTTDDSEAIQALLDTEDYVYLPKGTYYIAKNPLKMTRDHCTFICDGTLLINATNALELSASFCHVKIAHIKNRWNGSWTEADSWSFNVNGIKIGSTTGHVQFNTVEVDKIERCRNAIWIVPDGEGFGVAHNTIRFGEIFAEYGIRFQPGAAAYVYINTNHFYGGRLKGKYPIYTEKGTNQVDYFNGNNFHHIAYEGCQRPMTLNYFSYNHIQDMRLSPQENSAIVYPNPHIILDEYSFGNVINVHGSFNVDQIVDRYKTGISWDWARWLGNEYSGKCIVACAQGYEDWVGDKCRSSHGSFIAQNDRGLRVAGHNKDIDLSENKYAIDGLICHITATARNVSVKLAKGYHHYGAKTIYLYIAERTDPYTVQVVQYNEETQTDVVIAPPTVFTETGMYKLECVTAIGWIVTKVDIINILPATQIPPIAPPVEPSTMKSMANWYDETAAGATMDTITSIEFSNSYTASGDEDASWAVDADGTGTITAYRNGTNVIVATTNGASKIKLNADSRRMFQANGSWAGDGKFSALSEITGTEMFVADAGTKVDNVCAGNTVLTAPICIPNGVTSMKGAFNNCTALQSAPTIPDGVTNLTSAFINCSALQTLPDIPESVEVLDYSFQGCTNATGTVVVDAQNLTSYVNAFANVARNSGGQVSLTGTCPLLAELAATKGAGNVVVGS